MPVTLKFSQISVGSLIQPVNGIFGNELNSDDKEARWVKTSENRAIDQADGVAGVFRPDELVILFNPQ